MRVFKSKSRLLPMSDAYTHELLGYDPLLPRRAGGWTYHRRVGVHDQEVEQNCKGPHVRICIANRQSLRGLAHPIFFSQKMSEKPRCSSAEYKPDHSNVNEEKCQASDMTICPLVYVYTVIECKQCKRFEVL